MEIHTPTQSDQLPPAFYDSSQNVLRPAQMTEHYNDLQHAQNDLENPKVQDKAAVKQRQNSIKRQVESQAPRQITDGKLKDALAAREKQLLDEIVPVLLSKEEMRKNPPGATDRYRRGEGSTQIKKKILEWKKIKIVQQADGSDPHTWDRDAANLERFRPDGPQDKFRADAQITGKMTYGNIPDEKWEQSVGPVNPPTSALAQAKRVADEARLAAEESIGLTLPDPLPKVQYGRKPMSEEQKKLVADNLRRGREAKKLRLKEMIEKGV